MSDLLMVLGLIYAISFIGILVVLLTKDRMNSGAGLVLLIVSLIFTGILLQGVPDVVTQMMGMIQGLFSDDLTLVPLVGIGVLSLTVLLASRLFCGYVCPLGVIQELASRAGLRQVEVSGRTSQRLRALFFIVLVVIALAVTPYRDLNPLAVFTLHPSLIQSSIFIGIFAAALFVYRPWCTLLCPFGILANLVSRLSVLRLRIDERECIDCGECTAVCPTSQPIEEEDLPECYVCMRCVEVCPVDAIEARR